MSVKFDTSDFDRTLKKLVKITKVEPAKFLNEQMFFIVWWAMKNTPRATRADIEKSHEGFQGYKESTRRETGEKYDGKAIVSHDRGLANIIQGARINRKQKPFTKAQLVNEVRKRFTRKLSAIGSLAAGFLSPLVRLGKAIGNHRTQKAPRVNRRGRASVAKPGTRMYVTAEYRLPIKMGSSRKKDIDPRVEAAFSKSFRNTGRDLKRKLERLLQKKFDEHNRI